MVSRKVCLDYDIDDLFWYYDQFFYCSVFYEVQDCFIGQNYCFDLFFGYVFGYFNFGVVFVVDLDGQDYIV